MYVGKNVIELMTNICILASSFFTSGTDEAEEKVWVWTGSGKYVIYQTEFTA